MTRSRGRMAVWLAVPVESSLRVAGLDRDIRVKPASTRQEWEEALQLVTDKYQARGFEGAGQHLRFTSYHALPDSTVLVAKESGRVIATFTLVLDNHLLGLPMESIYAAEVKALRQAGHRLVETTCLADRDLNVREFVHVFTALIRLAWQTVGAATNVITVNPRHRAYYQKAYGYLPLGGRRSYGPVQGAPAEAFYLTPEGMKARAPAMYEQVFDRPLPPRLLAAAPMPTDLVRDLARRSSQTDPRLIEEVLRYVHQHGSPRRW